MCQIKCEYNGRDYALGFPALINLVISIIALYYGITNQDNLCSDSFIHLAIWMIVQGAVMLFVTCGFLPSVLLGKVGLCIYALVFTLYSLFNVIWSIIGGVILWRDSKPCEDLNPAFYAASMTVVISSLIMAFCSLCCSSGKMKNNNDDN